MAKVNAGKSNSAAEKAAAEKAAAEKAAAEKAAAEKAAAEKVAAEADAAEQAGTKQSNSVTTVPALSVVSRREGFRRAGRVWGKEAVTIALSDLSDEQIAQLKGEALLAVTETEIETADE